MRFVFLRLIARILIHELRYVLYSACVFVGPTGASVQRFRRILVYIWADEPLPSKLMAAVDLAHRNDAVLTLYDVVPALDKRRRFARSSRGEIDVERDLAEARRTVLEHIADDLAVPRTDVAIGRGDPYVEIIREVMRGAYDLVLTAPDEPGRRSFTGASTTMHLLRKSPVPVWVHSRGAIGATGIAVAVGPFGGEHTAAGLNRKLMELASSLAAQREEPLHVISAWSVAGEQMMRSSRSPFTEREVDEMLYEARLEIETAVDELLAEIAPVPVPVERHIVKGEPGLHIPQTVADLEVSTLVLGTIARKGLAGMLIGSTAEQILGRIQISVLAVKPEGFETPISVA